MLRPLKTQFEGRGSVKGYLFTQICSPIWGFIYKVEYNGHLHYEVFKHRENAYWKVVSYPTEKAFGIWAYTTSSLKRAKEILESFK